jgi:Short C-terminal domain
MRVARERRVAAASPSAVPGEQRLAALERLGRLRDSNVLDEDEFEAEKARILSG